MERFSLNIKTCYLYVIWESKIKFGQKFFATPKICTPVHLCCGAHVLARRLVVGWITKYWTAITSR